MGTTKRIFHLDAIKAVLIGFVLYDHAPLLPIGSIPANLSILLAEMGVAVFFIVSGATGLARDLPPKDLFARVFYAYLGLLFWKAVYLLLSPWVFSFPLRSASRADILVYLFFFGNIEGIETRHFWFTHAYISMLLATPFLRAFLCRLSASCGHPESPGHGRDAAFPPREKAPGMAVMRKTGRAFGHALPLLYRFLPLILTWLLGTFPFTLRYMSGKNGTFLTELNPFGAYSYMMFYYLLGGYLYLGLFRREPPHRGLSLSTQNPAAGDRQRDPQKTGRRGETRGQWKVLGGSVLLLASGLGVQLFLYHGVFHSFGWQGQQLPGHSYMTSAIPIAAGSFLFLRSFFLLSLPEEKAGTCRLLRRVLQGIGQRTLGIYYLHMLLLLPISRLLSPWAGIGVNLLKCLLVLLPCMLLILVLKRLPLIRHFV